MVNDTGDRRGEKTLRLSELLDIGRPTCAIKPQCGDKRNSNID
jgi:hypothetical protein